MGLTTSQNKTKQIQIPKTNLQLSTPSPDTPAGHLALNSCPTLPLPISWATPRNSCHLLLPQSAKNMN